MAGFRELALEALLRGNEGAMELDEAALTIAGVEFPDTHYDESLRELDRHAHEIGKSMGRGFRTAAGRYLFEKLGFGGNDEDYYNPRNSCLNWVLESKRGIPISLSVVYMEVARRLDVKVDGIAAPGHFVVRLEEAEDVYFLDPFRRGAIRDDMDGDLDPRLLEPASKRTIAVRMLNNLRQIYIERRTWLKAEEVLNWVLIAQPNDADAVRQRAAARAAMQKYRAAAMDLERFLVLAPESADRKELEEQVTRLRRMHASTN